MATLFQSLGNLWSDGVINSLVPIKPIGTTGTSGYEAESLAIPVFPGSRKGGSFFFDLVPSGKIPNARFACRTNAALDSASAPPVYLFVSIWPVALMNEASAKFLKCPSLAR